MSKLFEDSSIQYQTRVTFLYQKVFFDYVQYFGNISDPLCTKYPVLKFSNIEEDTYIQKISKIMLEYRQDITKITKKHMEHLMSNFSDNFVNFERKISTEKQMIDHTTQLYK